jgi:hypothetical protein
VAYERHRKPARTSEEGGPLTGRSATLLGVDDYDNPETIRFKKYATG